MPQRLTALGPARLQQSGTILLAALAAGIASCTPAPIADKEARARDATASALGTAPDQIEISELESGAAKWTWRAVAGGKTYACDADELMRLPNCLLNS